MKLTIRNLKAKGACAEVMEWITPIIKTAPDTVADRLCREHPEWHQWAVANGFDVPVSPEAWAQMGCVMVDGELRHVKVGGYMSTRHVKVGGYMSTRHVKVGGYESTLIGGDRSTLTSTPSTIGAATLRLANGSMPPTRHTRNGRNEMKLEHKTYAELTEGAALGAIGWAGLLWMLGALMLTLALVRSCSDGPDPKTSAMAGTYHANQGGYL